MTAVREQEYITTARALTKQVWEGIHALVAMQAEWNALDYGTTLDNGTGGFNDGILAADVGAVVFATADALSATLSGGHATNMAKLL